MKNLYIETERLLLTTADKSMAEQILEFYNNNIEHLKSWEDAKEENFYTLYYQKALIRDEIKRLKNGTSADFWIFTQYEGKLIGKVSVFSISSGNLASCMLGYKLDKDSQSKGYMHEALTAVINFMFNEMNLHRIEICVVPRNERSVKVVQRLGFYKECVCKSYMRVNNVWEDHIRFVKINENYREF